MCGCGVGGRAAGVAGGRSSWEFWRELWRMDSFVDHVEIPPQQQCPPANAPRHHVHHYFFFHRPSSFYFYRSGSASHRRRPPPLSADQTTMPSSSDESMDPAQMLINGLKVRFVGYYLGVSDSERDM